LLPQWENMVQLMRAKRRLHQNVPRNLYQIWWSTNSLFVHLKILSFVDFFSAQSTQLMSESWAWFLTATLLQFVIGVNHWPLIHTIIRMYCTCEGHVLISLILSIMKLHFSFCNWNNSRARPSLLTIARTRSIAIGNERALKVASMLVEKSNISFRSWSSHLYS
jgi:hypothetical protein